MQDKLNINLWKKLYSNWYKEEKSYQDYIYEQSRSIITDIKINNKEVAKSIAADDEFFGF